MRDIIEVSNDVVAIRKKLVVCELNPLTREELMDEYQRLYCIVCVVWGGFSYAQALDAFAQSVLPSLEKSINEI